MEEEKVISSAMQIILYAGDARTYTEKALDCLELDQYGEAEEWMAKARESIIRAHQEQTNIIQADAAGDKLEYSMLFTHAQDTLMTNYGEYHVAEKMVRLYKALSKKIESMDL